MPNKTLLVTGASRRIGAAICQRLHAAGWRVIVHYRSQAQAAQALVDGFNALRPQSALALCANLLDLQAVQNLAVQAIQVFGQVDALVNNASSFYPTALGEIGGQQWDDLMGSNLQAPLFLSQALADELRLRQGCIVNIADIHAQRPMHGYPVYSAAKAGLVGLTKALAVELAPAVRVNAVAPGPIAWPEGAGQFNAAEQERVRQHTLLKRTGSPDDIAKAVQFLIEDAPFVTGQILAVDGGRSVNM